MDSFSVWVRRLEGDTPSKAAGPFQEPAKAADEAERRLRIFGVPGVSYAELRYNGDTEPHTVIFLMEDSTRAEPVYGVWNTPAVRWPIFYAENNEYGVMLDGYPDGFETKTPDDETSDGFGDTDEDSKTMDLSNDGSEDEKDDADEDGEDESEEDESQDEEDDSSDDESDSDLPEDGNDDDENTDSDEPDEEDADDEEDSDDGDGDDSDAEDSDESEDEKEDGVELPRLKLFAKMRGPLGWRKRAELEDLNDRNVWALKVGVLDPDAEKPAAQERNVFAQIEVIEKDENHASATLRMKLPEGVTLGDFTQTKAGWITAELPLPHEG